MGSGSIFSRLGDVRKGAIKARIRMDKNVQLKSGTSTNFFNSRIANSSALQDYTKSSIEPPSNSTEECH